MAHVLATLRARVGQLLARRQLEPEDDHTPADPLAETSPVLAGLVSASVQGAPRPGPQGRRPCQVPRRRAGPRASHLSRPAPGPSRRLRPARQRLGPHTNRARLEQLCRYLLCPPLLAQDRLHLRPDGRVLVELKTVWRDGTSHFLFEPIEFLETLAALIPRPR